MNHGVHLRILVEQYRTYKKDILTSTGTKTKPKKISPLYHKQLKQKEGISHLLGPTHWKR
jgi:hypothetical protein